MKYGDADEVANLLFVAKMIQVETIIMNRATAMRDAVKLASRI